MFKHHIAPPPMTEEDKRVSKTLIDLWTSFAKSGFDVQQLHNEQTFHQLFIALQ
jgi:Carboxylesterase family